MSQKRIAVVGAGPCGITAAKCCLEENLDVVVFEKTDGIGGFWRYRENDTDDIPSVMKSTIIKTSKEISAFSDFPPPKEFPNFLNHYYMLRYIQMYAENFDVFPKVRLCVEVIDISPTEDYEKTGRWYVTFKKIRDRETYRETFDGVMVAIGHHTYPNWPKLSGLDGFEGTVIHTHSLKKATGFEDKNVLVVGIGNSAVDAAVELSTVAKQVYLSTRRGAWLFHHVGAGGMPFDVTYLRRDRFTLQKVVPFKLMCWFLERQLNERLDHKKYGLKPKHRVLSQHPTINDALPSKLLSGAVVLRDDIKEFTKTGVVFKNESSQTDIDAVILATGYDIKFPFISENLVQVKNNKLELYKYIFPPNLRHATLAMIGVVQVSGAVFPIAEAQSRWYALIMAGKKKLPPKDVMISDIKTKSKANVKRYVDSPRRTVQVDYVPYLDEMAKEIGCEPKFLDMLYSDPKLFWACVSGPCLPYQYRLRGPNSWTGAKGAILGFEKRLLFALNTRENSKNPTRV